MTGNDIKEIGKLLDTKLKESEDRLNAKIAGSEDRLNAKIAGSEDRLNAKIAGNEDRLNAKLKASESRVIGEVGRFIEDNLFPLIEEKADKADIDRLESKLDRFIDTSLDHESRIKEIERIPIIAHELKIKKRK